MTATASNNSSIRGMMPTIRMTDVVTTTSMTTTSSNTVVMGIMMNRELTSPFRVR